MFRQPRIWLALAAAVPLLMASVPVMAEGKFELAKALQVDAGKTRADVEVILGPPGNREFSGNLEAWQYCARDGATNKYVVVFFKDGSVDRLVTYARPWFGDCGGQYRTIKWGGPNGGEVGK